MKFVTNLKERFSSTLNLGPIAAVPCDNKSSKIDTICTVKAIKLCCTLD